MDVPLSRLYISKILFTKQKAEIIYEVLTSSNCKITELNLDGCRANSDNMSIIFNALSKNKSVVSLKMKNMQIPIFSTD